jgi:hypothetical protein
MEKHSEVAWTLLKDIIPKYGISDSIQSDGGPDFVSEKMKQVNKALGIQWKSHDTWRSQSTHKGQKNEPDSKKDFSH